METNIRTRLANGERLRDILDWSFSFVDINVEKLTIFPDNDVDIERAKRTLPEVIETLNRDLQLTPALNLDDIVLKTVGFTQCRQFMKAGEGELEKVITEFALSEFYNWAFGIDLSKKREFLAATNSPRLGIAEDLYITMPKLVVPGNENEIAMSIGNDAIINIFRAIRDLYSYRVFIPRLDSSYDVSLYFPTLGETRICPKKYCGKREGYISVSFTSPESLLDVAVLEHFHYLVKNITLRNSLNDIRGRKPSNFQWHEDPKENQNITKIILDIQNRGELPTRVKTQWHDLEEGLVHAAGIEWMIFVSEKYNLDIVINEDSFVNEGGKAGINYTLISKLRSQIRDKGFMHVFKTFRDKPQDIFLMCFPNGYSRKQY